MADEVLSIRKMTVDELRANPPKIDKKFILVNRSLYTDEAFEYLLELINETDAVVFISDTRQIYTHGEYFGGDVWDDKLVYFSTFQIFNDSEEELSKIKAEITDDTLRIQGINNITLTPEEYYSNGDKVKILKIGYDIANSIDTSVFTIDDPTAQFNLEIKDSKISVNKYIPVRVELSENNNIFEYDNYPDTISFGINIYGTSSNKYITAASDNNAEITFNESYTEASVNVTSNTDTHYLILYSDEQTQGSVAYTQEFGYGICWSNTEITANNFMSLPRKIMKYSCESDFFITQGENEFGWFACPSNCTPTFIDMYSGLRGGWKKYGNITVYSLNIDYTVWRTENSGLGEVKWTVKEYKNNNL